MGIDDAARDDISGWIPGEPWACDEPAPERGPAWADPRGDCCTNRGRSDDVAPTARIANLWPRADTTQHAATTTAPTS